MFKATLSLTICGDVEGTISVDLPCDVSEEHPNIFGPVDGEPTPLSWVIARVESTGADCARLHPADVVLGRHPRPRRPGLLPPRRPAPTRPLRRDRVVGGRRLPPEPSSSGDETDFLPRRRRDRGCLGRHHRRVDRVRAAHGFGRQRGPGHRHHLVERPGNRPGALLQTVVARRQVGRKKSQKVCLAAVWAGYTRHQTFAWPSQPPRLLLTVGVRDMSTAVLAKPVHHPFDPLRNRTEAEPDDRKQRTAALINQAAACDGRGAAGSSTR